MKLFCLNPKEFYYSPRRRKPQYYRMHACFLPIVETVGLCETGFIFLGSKITANGDCSHGIKRRLFLGRIAIKNLDSILKSRDITLLTKVQRVKAMFFPVVMYGCESWTRKMSTKELLLSNCGTREDF